MDQTPDRPDQAGLRMLRFSDVPATPWKNGAGITRELYVSPPAGGSSHFDWRVSVAEVAGDGPFSSFPGVDRTLMLVDGPGMTVTVDGRPHDIVPLTPFWFSGDSTTSCRLRSGPTRDLNLMVRRDRVAASFDVEHVAGSITMAGADATTVLVVALSGQVAATAGDRLLPMEPLDSVRLDGADTDDGPAPDITLLGEGSVVIIRLRPAAGRSAQAWMMGK